jgi:hypothetical protein
MGLQAAITFEDGYMRIFLPPAPGIGYCSGSINDNEIIS